MIRIAEKVNFRRGHWVRCVKETIISAQIRVFAIIVAKIFSNEDRNLDFLRSI